MRSDSAFDRQEVFQVPVRVEEILCFGWSSRDMEFAFIEHQRDLDWREINLQDLKVISVLPVDQAVPGVTAASSLEQFLAIGRTAQHVRVAEIVGKDLVGRRQAIAGGQTAVLHERQVITVVLGVELQGKADLVEMSKACGCAAGLFGAAQSRQQQSRKHTDNAQHNQQLN